MKRKKTKTFPDKEIEELIKQREEENSALEKILQKLKEQEKTDINKNEDDIKK